MMMKRLIRPILILLLTALASAPAAGQTAQAARERAEADRARTAAGHARLAHEFQEGAERRAFDMLLRHRAQLELSEQQVQRIRAIGARLEQRNAPLRQRLMAEHDRWMAARRAQVERMSAAQRRAELARLRAHSQAHMPESLQPTVRQMRVHIDEAVQQAQAVLTARQRVRAQELVRLELRAAARARVQARRATREEAVHRHQEERSEREQRRQRERERERARRDARQP
jgi:hypothetical protein